MIGFRNKVFRQSSGLIVGQGLGIVLSFLFTVIVTRGLSVEDYGLFRYAMTFLALGMTALQLGWPYSASRLLALEKEKKPQEEIVGTCIVVLVISSVVAVVGTFAISHIARSLGYKLPTFILWIAPFLYVTLGQAMLRNICQGLNRIRLLASQQVLPYLLLLPATALQIFVFQQYSLEAAIIGYVITFTVVLSVGFINVGISFKNWCSWMHRLHIENKHTGFPIYIGGLFGVASAQVIALVLAGMVDGTVYGQYALALAISAPLSVLVSSIGTVIFRSSSEQAKLPRGLIRNTAFFGVGLAIIYYFVTELLLVKIFGHGYALSVFMAQGLGVGALMIGMGDIFQRFLGSKGKGKELCYVAVATGVVGIVTAVVFLPLFKTQGAILSSFASAATYFVLLVRMYLKTSRHGGFVDGQGSTLSGQRSVVIQTKANLQHVPR